MVRLTCVCVCVCVRARSRVPLMIPNLASRQNSMVYMRNTGSVPDANIRFSFNDNCYLNLCLLWGYLPTNITETCIISIIVKGRDELIDINNILSIVISNIFSNVSRLVFIMCKISIAPSI